MQTEESIRQSLVMWEAVGNNTLPDDMLAEMTEEEREQLAETQKEARWFANGLRWTLTDPRS